MQIYVVKPGDTLYSIGRTLSLAPGFLARYNGLQEPYRLAVGQSLLALYPEKAVTVQAGDTLSSIAASAGTDVLSLFRMNPNLSGSDRIYPGQILVTQLEQNRTRSAFVAGYAYPYVQESVLRGILPFTGALMPFTYGFTPEGALVPMDDERLLALAEDYGVRPFLHLSTLTAAGTFSAAQAAVVLRSETLQRTLAEAALQKMQEKGYQGLDVDFEYLGQELAEAYAQFLTLLHERLAPYGLPLIAALAPKTSADQPGTLYEGHDYAAVASACDAVLLAVVTAESWQKIQKDLRRKMQIDVPGTGIAFIVPLSSIGGKRALMFLTEHQSLTWKEESTLKDTRYELLLVVANQGYTGSIMDAARTAGAGGGTVIHAKGTGMEGAAAFLGVELVNEKELVLIVSRTSQKNTIMKAIMEGANPKAGAIVFSLPVTDTAGLRLMEEDEAQPEAAL